MDQNQAEALTRYIQDNVPVGEPFVVLCLIEDFPAVMGAVSATKDEQQQKEDIAAFILHMLMTMDRSIGAAPDQMGAALEVVKKINKMRETGPMN